MEIEIPQIHADVQLTDRNRHIKEKNLRIHLNNEWVDVEAMWHGGNEERKRTIINFTLSFTILHALLTIFEVKVFLKLYLELKYV